MPEESDIDRRSFLKYGGTVAATISIAGCSGDDEDPTADDDGADDDGADDDGADDDGTSDDGSSDDGSGDDGSDDGSDDDDGMDEEFSVTVTQGTLTDTLDPVGENATPVYNIIDQAYEPFLYREPNGQVIERIVTDWERTGDNQVQLTIRDGVQFHSGSELTAEDVAFSINRANDSDLPSSVAAVIGDIDEAVAEDGDVVVNLNAVVPAIFRNLAAFGRVQEQAWVEENAGDDGFVSRDINGTGPYQLVEFEEGSYVDYEKFEDYWGPEPEVDTARLNARAEDGPRVEQLLAGESDIIVNVSPGDVSDVESADNADVEFGPSIRSIFLVMNDAKEPFDSVEFRQAMNYAVDVEAIVDSVLNGFGEPTSQPTLEGHNGHNPDLDPYGYDPEQAETLVEESGYAGAEITLHTTTGRYLRDVDVADAAAGQIDELSNVSASVDRRETLNLFDETLDGDQDTSPGMFLIGWGVPTFDAAYAMSDWFLDDGLLKHTDNEEIRQLLNDADNEPDPDARLELLQEANTVAHEQATWVFLYQQFGIYGISNRIDWSSRQDEDILLEEISQA